ncbi:MAG: diguanylate cyclase domain-containing protein, partial [Nitrososphaeraceae archaeon]
MIYSIIFKPFKKSNTSFLIFSIITFIISTCAFFMTLANNYNFALILAYILTFGVMLQPIATLILIVDFAGYKNSKLKEIYKYLLYLIPLAIIAMLLLTKDINSEITNFGYVLDVSNMKLIAPFYFTSVNIFAASFLGFKIHRRKKLGRFYRDILVFLTGIILYILGQTIYSTLQMTNLVIKVPSSSISIILFYLFILISLFSIKTGIYNISMKRAFENVQDCIIISDYRGDILEFNECLKKKLFREREDQLNQDYSSENIKKLISKMISSKNESDGFFKLLKSNSKDKSKIEMIIKNNGNLLTYDISISPILDKSDNILGKISIFRDITLSKEYEKKIEYFSFHDKLTGLYNRRYFEEELKRLDTKRQLPISIIMADIDGLKYVNDKFGHNCGDKLINDSSNIIKNSCRKEDIVARW